MKKSLKNLLIVGLVISSNGLIGSEKPGKITEEQKAAVLPGQPDNGNNFTALKKVGIPTDPNTNPTRLQQVAAAAKNWWNKK